MADLLNILQSQLGGNALNLIANQIGGNQKQTNTAISAALPVLMQALNRNASNQQGAESLFNAIAKDHDGGLLEDVAGFVGNFQNGPGAGIIKHVLGPKTRNVENMVANTSGLNQQSVGKLFQILAPVLMGQLGKQQKQSGFDVGSLVSLLNTNVQQQQKRRPKSTSMLNQLLDQDGDGNINDEIANLGLKALSGLFRR